MSSVDEEYDRGERGREQEPFSFLNIKSGSPYDNIDPAVYDSGIIIPSINKDIYYKYNIKMLYSR